MSGRAATVQICDHSGRVVFAAKHMQVCPTPCKLSSVFFEESLLQLHWRNGAGCWWSTYGPGLVCFCRLLWFLSSAEGCPPWRFSCCARLYGGAAEIELSWQLDYPLVFSPSGPKWGRTRRLSSCGVSAASPGIGRTEKQKGNRRCKKVAVIIQSYPTFFVATEGPKGWLQL